MEAEANKKAIEKAKHKRDHGTEAPMDFQDFQNLLSEARENTGESKRGVGQDGD